MNATLTEKQTLPAGEPNDTGHSEYVTDRARQGNRVRIVSHAHRHPRRLAPRTSKSVGGTPSRTMIRKVIAVTNAKMRTAASTAARAPRPTRFISLSLRQQCQDIVDRLGLVGQQRIRRRTFPPGFLGRQRISRRQAVRQHEA